MDNLLIKAILLLPFVLLLWSVIPSSWLNRHPAKVGLWAERMAWVGLVLTLAAAGKWFFVNGESVSITVAGSLLGARMDSLSIVMLVLVAFLGAVILRFSRNYLAGDKQQGYFFKWMAITLGAVSALVVSPGLVQFFSAWVLTSLGLHKLLVYFPDRLGTLLSARKKFIVSRIGDICLLAGFWGIFGVFGSESFETIFAGLESAATLAELANASWIAWAILFGAILKSAQFPFHTWLPDTMGAPTPVSALMHAGIINAGGFLVIRLSPVLVEIPGALHFLAIVGVVTALLAGMVMLTQTSVKRALAYSTIAQMGFMFLQCGLGAFHLAMLHIVAHSLYKGHAFLSSGSAVDTIRPIASSRSQAALSTSMMVGIVVGACSLVALLHFLFGITPQEKPGMLVFSVILALAVSHFAIKKLQVARDIQTIVKTVALGSGFTGLYLGLAVSAQALFASELPQMSIVSGLFEASLAVLVAALLMMSIWVQSGKTLWLPLSLRSAFYVHALNGFYLNTIANRISRAMGLVPQKH